MNLHPQKVTIPLFFKIIENLQLFRMSVNPVIGVGAYNVSNATIKPFNDALKKNFPDYYLDRFSHLQKAGYYAADGQHYDTATYRKVYDYIKKATGWIS